MGDVSVCNSALERRLQSWTQAALLVSALLVSGRAEAEPARPIRVLGSVSLHATATLLESPRGGDEVRIEGRLTDDAGRGVAKAQLTIEPEGGASTELRSRPCPASTSSSAWLTDEEGRFCTLVAAASWRGARLGYVDPHGLLGRAEATLSGGSLRRRIKLDWVRLTPEVSLDVPLHAFEVATSLPANAEELEEIGVELGLESPHGGFRTIQRVFVHPNERARFEVDATTLGSPGSTMLVARVGQGAFDADAARQRVTKVAHVEVTTPARELRLKANDTLPIPVGARWQRGTVTTGTIEARRGDALVAATTLEDGRGELTLSGESFSETAPGSARLTLHYVSNAPWWRPGPATEVVVALEPPSPWTRLPWFLASLALVAWVALIWKRPAPRAKVPTLAPAEPPGREGLLVEETKNDALLGQVLDAHTAEPVAGAKIVVTAAALGLPSVLAEVVTDAEGRFTLSLDEPGAAPRSLAATAPGYGELTRPLPRRGRLTIHLVTLRRSLVDRLVAWAKRKGAPWYDDHAPTPLEVADIARARSSAHVERWATDVEAAAFGPTDPSATTERELREAEPP